MSGLRTSKSVSKAMKLWDISGDGRFWKVQLDVRDLGGLVLCLAESRRLLPYLLVFQVKLGLVRGKYIPAGPHAAEASYVSSSSLSAFRAAIVRAVWSSKMPLANTPTVLNLLGGPVGVDPALHFVWVSFRMMRRYLACCPEKEPRIFRMFDLIAGGAQGHGPVHLLLTSAAELGFAWDVDEKGWVRPSLPHLRMIAGPIQHFFSSILDAWRWVRVGIFLLAVPTRRLRLMLALLRTGGSLKNFSVFARFRIDAWMADVACPVVCQPVWPACWLDTPKRSFSSSSRVVQDVWDVYRDELGVVPDDVVLALRDAASRSSVDDFWSLWSRSAEDGLFRAYSKAGGPTYLSW